jgi:hypothetical protein
VIPGFFKTNHMPEFFKNPDVAANYEPADIFINGVPQDFKIRVPQAKWPERGNVGYFSDITPAVAEQLIKEGFNRIKLKEKDSN